jgi:pyridoxamine 5'-phosphate oxidase
MIKFINVDSSAPYKKFISFYNEAIDHEKYIDAICISSFNKSLDRVESRFVNLKYIIRDEWIFFTNYKSPKANDFESHNQISAVFFWPSTYSQIRIRAKIAKTSCDFSDKHFMQREPAKNKIAVISEQSKKIESYDALISKLDNLNSNYDLSKRPNYWGGYSFKPYYFEFWEGHESRINKRKIFEKIDGVWEQSFLQP